MELRGAFTALVTPFKDGMIDEENFRALIERQIEDGINGLVPCGTTGESATLTHDEHNKVISICVEQAKKRVPIIAGAGSNNTREAIELTKYAEKVGADAALHITPYYNKPTQDGLIAHFSAIAAETKIPLIPYNVPGRTSLNMLPKTIAVLAKTLPSVIGVKEASGDLKQISEVLEMVDDKFSLLSGDDFTILPTLAIGGKGVISVVSNIVPAKISKLCSEFFNGNLDAARRIHFEISELNRMMFVETNPIPVKASLGLMQQIHPELRLPLCGPSKENLSRIAAALKSANLLN